MKIYFLDQWEIWSAECEEGADYNYINPSSIRNIRTNEAYYDYAEFWLEKEHCYSTIEEALSMNFKSISNQISKLQNLDLLYVDYFNNLVKSKF